jgi:hypothetical protein
MLKITMKTTKIPSEWERKKKANGEEMRNREEMNWGGVGVGFYTAILPTTSPTEYLNNIIFNYSVGEF